MIEWIKSSYRFWKCFLWHRHEWALEFDEYEVYCPICEVTWVSE